MKPSSSLTLGARIPKTNLAAPVLRLGTVMEAGNRERARLYGSKRWRQARRLFLRANPICCTPDCRRAARAVDHKHGHQHAQWWELFWDETTWQPQCLSCHAKKCAAELAAWRQAGEGIPLEKGMT